MPAIALTDQSNLFAMVKFYKEAQAAGVKPLIGVDAWIREPGERAPPSRIVFLCQNLVGYRHLTQLVTRSFLEGQYRGVPMMERAWLDRAGPRGPDRAVRRRGGRHRAGAGARQFDEAERCLARWQALCGDRFYLEVQRTGRAGEEAVQRSGAGPGARARRAAVATNDVRFLTRAEFEAHEARVCIREGALLADPSRAAALFRGTIPQDPGADGELFADAPELLVNTVEIAKRCSLEIKLGSSMLPAYPVPAGSTTEDFLRDEAERGLAARLDEAPASGATLRRRRRLCGAARARARRDLQHGIRGLLPDRRRLHPLGARATACRWARAAARARARWWRTRSASPTSTRSSMTFCSSGS